MAMVQKMGRKAVEMFSDSRLVVGQVKGELEVRDATMQEYLSQVKRLQSHFDLSSLSHVSRSGNTRANSLITLATSLAGGLPRTIIVEHLDRANEAAKSVVHIHQISVGPSWMDLMVEAEPLANIRDVDAKKFLWRNIVTQFKILYTLFSDNGLQFDSKAFRRCCCELEITNRYSTQTSPQENGQAKTVNKVIVNRLKKRLDDARERWVEELPHVLWTYRTTSRRSTGETPFAMTYGAEAVIPLEVNFPTLRTSSFTPSSNNELLGKSLDLIDERRERAVIQLVYYHQKLK
nr:hypothetical protein CFP56_15491 [Quercus suber]